MHKKTIVSVLALTAFTQTGCGIITHFVQKKKSDDAAAADAADQKALKDRVAAKDLSKLKTECAGTAETSFRTKARSRSARWTSGSRERSSPRPPLAPT